MKPSNIRLRRIHDFTHRLRVGTLLHCAMPRMPFVAESHFLKPVCVYCAATSSLQERLA